MYGPPAQGREWRPIQYRRNAAAKPESERADDEARERARWGNEVLTILAEADLPYIRTSGVSGGAVDQRCCLGLRARTLAKRVRDGRPFRRFLIAHGHGAFPTGVGQVLSYLEARTPEGISACGFNDLHAALRFFEQA